MCRKQLLTFTNQIIHEKVHRRFINWIQLTILGDEPDVVAVRAFDPPARVELQLQVRGLWRRRRGPARGEGRFVDVVTWAVYSRRHALR